MMTLIIVCIVIFLLTFIGSSKKRTKKMSAPYGSLSNGEKLANENTPVIQNSTPAQSMKPLENHQDIEVETIIKRLMEHSANANINVSNTVKAQEPPDDSVIDISKEPQNITIPLTTSQPGISITDEAKKVVPWFHKYIFSYNEIDQATKRQQEFYQRFKYCFQESEYLDLEGYSNYAFILLFDIINQYEKHQSFLVAEGQLRALAKNYPVTATYTISLFLQRLRQRGDVAAIESLRGQYNLYQVNRNFDGLGARYKAKLQLKEKEVTLLNKLFYDVNKFCGIEACLIEILKVYLSVFEMMDERLTSEGKTFNDSIQKVTDAVLTVHFKYSKGSTNYMYQRESVTNDIYTNIFKRCENLVRERYGHKRRVTLDLYYLNSGAQADFDQWIGEPVTEILPSLSSIIRIPDDEIEIELNSQNTNRWKIRFDEYCNQCQAGDATKFKEQVISLGKANEKNPSVENIFFEASRFIAKSNRQEALELYIYYLHYDLKSAAFDNKRLTKSIQKSLFQNEQQLKDFENVIMEFVNDKDLQKALAAVSVFYVPKRRKIQLDAKSIVEAQQLHSGTVELLNQYLGDEGEQESLKEKTDIGMGVTPAKINAVMVQQTSIDEVQFRLVPETIIPATSIYCNEIVFSDLQAETMELFRKNNFTVEKNELAAFAKSKGIFFSPLIENINDTCYGKLDDILIEEEEDHYVINQQYYQNILAI